MRRRWETVKRPRIYDRVVLRIVPLESRWVSLIARWHWDEWGHGDPSGSLEGWTAGLEKRVGREQLPLLLVAVDGDEPVGTASLVENDILSPDPRWSEIVERLRHATPWVSGVFVEPRHRRQGIASQLVEACIDRAKQLDADQLFLYTSTAQSLYERLGFAVIGREHTRKTTWLSCAGSFRWRLPEQDPSSAQKSPSQTAMPAFAVGSRQKSPSPTFAWEIAGD